MVVRLPQDDEWEYACRGGLGNQRPFYFGGILNGEQANCNSNFPYGTEEKKPGKKQTTAVGSYEKTSPHPWGLCDMHGNVHEWCETPEREGSAMRMIRGGSWDSQAWCCRSAYRSWGDPAQKTVNLGFRIALIPVLGQSPGTKPDSAVAKAPSGSGKMAEKNRDVPESALENPKTDIREAKNPDSLIKDDFV